VHVIISYWTIRAFETYGTSLVSRIRNAPVLHILCPMVRQIREMSEKIPPQRKKLVDVTNHDIVVDQFRFSHDVWSCIIPLSVQKMKNAVAILAEGIWWEQVADVYSDICVNVDEKTGDLLLSGVSATWKDIESCQLDVYDEFHTLIEMTFHGCGGGAARFTELINPTMHHCLYANETIYYSFLSLKVYNHASTKFKFVKRKLPPVIGRYFLLYRSIIQHHGSRLLKNEFDASLAFPERGGKSPTVTVRHVIQDLFGFERLPELVQVRHLTKSSKTCLTASDIGASKMGHSARTHATTYSSE